jgi:acetyl-CoA carboxylase carboxyltransferase component
MPLWRVTANPGEACTYTDDPDKPDSFLVHAKDEPTARREVVQWLIDEELFTELSTFASPVGSTVERVPARAPRGVVDVTFHHCSDHS